MSVSTTFPKMHVSLYVSDLQRSIEFYDRFFGQQPEKVAHKYAKYILDQPALIISFIEKPERVQANFGHLGFQVATEEILRSKLDWAREKGLVDREEIGTTCCYAVQDKFWATDPDNIQWEVYYFHKDAAFNDPKYDLSGESQCATKVELKDPAAVELTTAEACCEPGSSCC